MCKHVWFVTWNTIHAILSSQISSSDSHETFRLVIWRYLLLLIFPLEISHQPTEAVYGYKDLEVTSDPWIIHIFIISVKTTAVSWQSSNIAEKFEHPIWELVWTLRKVSSRAYKGIHAIPNGRSRSKGSLANCPQNHFRRLQSAGLKAWSAYRRGHQDQTTRQPKKQPDYTLSPRAENNCSSWLPRQAQRSKNKALLITAIIIISIVTSSPGHGPVPHCVSQCANREEKNGICPGNTQFKYQMWDSYNRNGGDKEATVSHAEESC